jgi:predicted dehydrogenase
VGTVRACGHEVVAIVGRDEARTRQVAAEENIALGTTDLAALEDVDAVVLASATTSHAALVERLLHKPLLCEKPLLGRPAEPEFAAALARPEVRLFVNYAFGYLDSAQALSRCIRSGALGPLEGIDLRVGVSLETEAPPEHWLLEVGAHPVAYLSRLLGAFERGGATRRPNGALDVSLRAKSLPLQIYVHQADEPGIEYRLVVRGQRGQARLEGTYRVGSTWWFAASFNDEPLGSRETSEHGDVWYRANCRCVAAVFEAFEHEATEDLIDGTFALQLEAPLWAPDV